MNLSNFLAYLTEAIDINEYRQKVGDDVPAETLDKLADKMRGTKYDNIALAITKKIQEINTSKKAYPKEAAPYIRFLKDHPNAVYSALKKAARNNPKFDPRTFIDFSIESADRNYGSPKRYWYSVYTADTPKMKKEDGIGLKNARVKELKDEYLIFPKTTKKIGEFGLSDNDLDKQWQELKALSQQMADKDTSGEIYKDPGDYDEDGEPKIKKATDNHWCVASSEDKYYKDYKDRDGLFVVIVKKNKDGSPDWNRRYLYYVTEYWHDEWDTDGEEFADKFDDHVRMEDHLSREAVNLLRSMKPAKSKKVKQKHDADNRAYSAFHDYRTNSNTAGGKEWDAFRKLVDVINDWVDEKNKEIKASGRFTYKSLSKTMTELLEKVSPKTPEGFINFLKGESGKIKTLRIHAIDDAFNVYPAVDVDDYSFVLSGKGNPIYTLRVYAKLNYSGNERVGLWQGSPEGIYRQFIDFASSNADNNKELNSSLSSRILYDKVNFNEVKHRFAPDNDYEPDEKFIRGNKRIADKYKEYKKNNRPQYTLFGIADLRVASGKNGYSVQGKNGRICDLFDPRMPEKVREYLDERDVAEGPEKIPF